MIIQGTASVILLRIASGKLIEFKECVDRDFTVTMMLNCCDICYE